MALGVKALVGGAVGKSNALAVSRLPRDRRELNTTIALVYVYIAT